MIIVAVEVIVVCFCGGGVYDLLAEILGPWPGSGEMNEEVFHLWRGWIELGRLLIEMN